MFFVIDCVDKAGHAEVRAANREAHLDYLSRFKERICVAGPTFGEDGQGMNGSVLILDFADRGAAEDFAAGDPYRQAGLFETVTIRQWKKVFPMEE
ncbi:MAG: YciI family protein [Alphaproteobacteria bacterium]|jgi:hypothetical protein|nr:YciI family protein [Rhodospirillales bacterium]MEE1561604.1 YciI family protein [Alphaproteobacteria bacterium]HIJ44480.1 YciI family protein [Rhodospirillaceae bacterium]MDP7098599.1 YciI family protein [Rhodospirillales bacterium]MDP7215862.1 YciI family protein [Rhodospirillales bacterium]